MRELNSPSLRAAFVLSVIATGCALFAEPGSPIARSGPPPRAPLPAGTAMLVLVYPRPSLSGAIPAQTAAPWIDVLDAQGEALARMMPGTFTTLSRPPG